MEINQQNFRSFKATVPTVNAPASLATSATIGAAPDPVPPPIPAVTKTRSLPATSLSYQTAKVISDQTSAQYSTAYTA